MESTSQTNSALKIKKIMMLSAVGTASIFFSSYPPINLPVAPTNDHHYECAIDNECDYYLKNEIMPQQDIHEYKDLEIIQSFIVNMIENSEESPVHFSKTIDKYFWDLV